QLFERAHWLIIRNILIGRVCTVRNSEIPPPSISSGGVRNERVDIRQVARQNIRRFNFHELAIAKFFIRKRLCQYFMCFLLSLFDYFFDPFFSFGIENGFFFVALIVLSPNRGRKRRKYGDENRQCCTREHTLKV